VNVNILSHLEKSRIEYLLTTGQSFSEAREQAEQEILTVFSITKPDITDFDLLNIAETGEDNAILLAISIITQGFRSESELSDLLANINTDLRQDGILNSAQLGSQLINDARLLNLPQIRDNIENRYSSLGMTVTIPNFEKYIQAFIDSTTYQITNLIEYPEFSNYGENILFANKTSFSSGLSMAAILPKGTSLKIVIRGGAWGYMAMPNPPINWLANLYENETQTFTAVESGTSCDLVFIWIGNGTRIIEYYENNATTPTKVKTIVN
jgi:hypothetical protein